MKHTPGPWELRGARLVTDSQGVVVAKDVSAHYPGTPEGNAALIAAAPELLAGCEEAETVLGELAHYVCKDHQEMADEMGARLRAAIAKAKGAQ